MTLEHFRAALDDTVFIYSIYVKLYVSQPNAIMHLVN